MKIDNQREIMNRFAEQRIKFGTQEKLAEIVGVSTKSISDFETCRRNPSFATFIKMCKTIGADINYIVYGNKEN
ncbi:MAG: helix-turn-helix transcriptional regulator [Clostridia bacterium]|nr:helix-turn-helix transcriptional regulator [Clostridia bacterium]